ncbi:DUF531 domain-containing protein [Methanothermococcus okinawensis]|uniref:DUF531 domain-containing protein n=1 Tax=Methanothermococcus okinawensis (strain DSM 14208 / JCM 11175 / IH1) TaxID=647113 RepID=F8AK47_METOI|nr:DUF531 domain-containing protein [Methanothermococcus okinawensis]AEH07414.1 protein of unknown function DUF531 [Methanothermococcus okinawensis IH1]
MKHLKRMTLILYNSYDKSRWHEAHKRAIARAAPICYAFNCNLAIMDFPCKKEDILSIETTIGNSGEYLKELIDNNRFSIIDKYRAQFGVPIITTSKPDERKLITPREIANLLLKKPCGIFVGLGRHGLPKNIIKLSDYQLDITEKRVSLETCTAIATIPSVISTYLKFL